MERLRNKRNMAKTFKAQDLNDPRKKNLRDNNRRMSMIFFSRDDLKLKLQEGH